MLDHAVGIFGAAGEAGLVPMSLAHMRAVMHACGVEPAKERYVRPRLTLHELDRGPRGLVVHGLHSLPGERAGVLDRLFPDASPARLLGWIVSIRRLAAQDPARIVCLPECRIAGIGAHFRLLLGIEVIEVAEELVEAMHRWQELVSVAEVVFAELSGGVSERLEQFGEGCVPRLQAHGGARNTNLREAGAQRALPGDERRASGRAA